MKVSMRTDYGVRAAIELASRFGQPPIPSAAIASAQGIPEQYLDQLLVALRKSGIVRSTRGPQGGHALAKAPASTSMGEVVAALEGRDAPTPCCDSAGRCTVADDCPQASVWSRAADASWGVLDSVSLAELVAERDRRGAREIYHI
jgi:Rrf2 family protein